MGTIRKGILGGFSGKVGTVVGSSWKGITLMRSLTPAVNAMATPVPGAVNFEWDDNSDWGDAKPTDKALIALVNPERRRVIYVTAGAQRSEATQVVNTPNEWMGENVDITLGLPCSLCNSGNLLTMWFGHYR